MRKPWHIDKFGAPFVDDPATLTQILFVSVNEFAQSLRPKAEVEECKRMAAEWKRLSPP